MNPEPDADADTQSLRALISALSDGQADASECARGCAAWSDGLGDARRSWHAYHLIGDVLRSEDLAGTPGRDREFLDRLRLRLAAEPVALVTASVSALAGSASRAPRRAGWVMPAALAAGVMALATVLMISLGPAGGSGSFVPLAAAPTPAPLAVAAAGRAGSPPVVEVSGQGSRLVRDARLDRYLLAHRDYGTALPGSLPGGAGRSITTVSLDR